MNTFIVHRSTGLTQPYGMLFEQYLDEIMRKPPFVAFALTAVSKRPSMAQRGSVISLICGTVAIDSSRSARICSIASRLQTTTI